MLLFAICRANSLSGTVVRQSISRPKEHNSCSELNTRKVSDCFSRVTVPTAVQKKKAIIYLANPYLSGSSMILYPVK